MALEDFESADDIARDDALDALDDELLGDEPLGEDILGDDLLDVDEPGAALPAGAQGPEDDAADLDASAESGTSAADLLGDAHDLDGAEFDEDDDLFDFDEIVQAALEETGFHQGIEDLLDEEDSAQEAEAELPAQPAPAAPAAAAPGAAAIPTADLLAAPSTGRSGRYVWQESGDRKGASPTVWVLVLVAACNLALVGVAWRSLGTMETAIDKVGARLSDPLLVTPADGSDEPRGEAPATTWRPPEVSTAPEGRQTLELAREDLERGAFGRARRRLYSLLAVLDRVEVSEREDVEARARLLVADSWRLEAEGPGEVAR